LPTVEDASLKFNIIFEYIEYTYIFSGMSSRKTEQYNEIKKFNILYKQNYK